MVRVTKIVAVGLAGIGVVELAFGAVEEEEMVRIALETWKKMSVEEKAFWRKKAKEMEGNIEKKN